MFKSLKIFVGQAINRDSLLEKFIEFDYEPCASVGQQGDIAHRGGVVDIYPVTFECPIRIELPLDKIDSIRSFNLSTGECICEHQMVVILPKKGIRPSTFRISPGYFAEEIPISGFVDIDIGDYVVHVNHGIGRYRGMDKLSSHGGYKDYLVIEYADGDLLYVPSEQMYFVQKYIGFEGRRPKLYKLGTKEWQRVKERARKGIFRLTQELLQVQAMRACQSGFAFSPDCDWQREFERGFPYKETPDQIRATLELKKDMESTRPMDRLLCGDVGYGKTEVALRAAFKAVMDNKQVAILVPTTILAEQHFNTFQNRFRDYPIVVRSLSRFNARGEQELILKGLSRGSIDIVIGTHRLLSDDVKFKDLGLVIIDEEQRFGVKHKEKLKRLRFLVDVLTLTATPIPRTLYMSLMGAKNLSQILTPPEERIPIQTCVTEYDHGLIRKAILNELRRGGQTYFVNNRVLGIDKIANRLKALIPEARIGLAHGQMSPRRLEETMLMFIRGQIDVLVSTNIVESGIDIPNANTLIVNQAQDFGLADLHQLRGRVGRFKVKAYAYFLVPKGWVLSQESKRRLKAIEEFTELGAGFKIAMEDLEIRGAGNLLGHEQHGYIMAIGFDLYCRLLRAAVAELKRKR